MKVCVTCKENLEDNSFYKLSGRLTISNHCKKCMNIATVKRHQNRKFELVSYKGGCCYICGYNKAISALEFHHTNPKDKEYDWNKLRMISLDKARSEVDKCVLLCSNCHREEHERLLIAG